MIDLRTCKVGDRVRTKRDGWGVITDTNYQPVWQIAVEHDNGQFRTFDTYGVFATSPNLDLDIVEVAKNFNTVDVASLHIGDTLFYDGHTARVTGITTWADGTFNVSYEVDSVTGKFTKPPLGIMPHKLWVESRCTELIDTLHRHRTTPQTINTEWLDELKKLVGEL